jgi:hypothetical protein
VRLRPAQRDPHVARADLAIVVQILELALVPDLHRTEIAVPVLADPDALGIVAVGAER